MEIIAEASEVDLEIFKVYNSRDSRVIRDLQRRASCLDLIGIIHKVYKLDLCFSCAADHVYLNVSYLYNDLFEILFVYRLGG